jgi:hypothetical protein
MRVIDREPSEALETMKTTIAHVSLPLAGYVALTLGICIFVKLVIVNKIHVPVFLFCVLSTLARPHFFHTRSRLRRIFWCPNRTDGAEI